MAMAGNTKIALSLIGLVCLASAINAGSTWYTERAERAQARDNIARADARAKAAVDQFAARKPAIIADALKLAESRPADALQALLKYESLDDPAIKAAMADVRIIMRNADVARARTMLKNGEAAEAYNLLLAHNKPGAPAEIGALFDQIRTAREKADAETHRAELAQRKRNGVTIGMTQERALQSSWGRPQSINRTITGNTVREQWVYPGMKNYLYFENGILTAIQN